MTPLAAFVNGWFCAPAQWGVSDCCLTALDWAGQVTGRDLGAALRYGYEDFAGAQKLTRFFSEPLGVAAQILERDGGLSRVAAPVRGDVAIWRWPSHDGRVLPVGGICVAPGQLVARSAPGQVPGLVFCKAPPLLAAWSVGYRDA